jgi:hypothetical protein
MPSVTCSTATASRACTPKRGGAPPAPGGAPPPPPPPPPPPRRHPQACAARKHEGSQRPVVELDRGDVLEEVAPRRRLREDALGYPATAHQRKGVVGEPRLETGHEAARERCNDHQDAQQPCEQAQAAWRRRPCIMPAV